MPEHPEHIKILSPEPHVHPKAHVLNCRLGEWTDIGPNCLLEETILGDYSYMDGDSMAIYTAIGKFCSIASHVRINPGNHPMQRVTQHHMTYRRIQYSFGAADDEDFFNWRRAHRCVIGHDVWIGHGAIIMPGVSVGTGAVIGSGSIVTKDVPPYHIVAGNPARLIRRRFPEEVAAQLLAIAWWDWSREMLKERFADLYNVCHFIEKYGEGSRT